VACQDFRYKLSHHRGDFDEISPLFALIRMREDMVFNTGRRALRKSEMMRLPWTLSCQ
jgi:hypothetical protein